MCVSVMAVLEWLLPPGHTITGRSSALAHRWAYVVDAARGAIVRVAPARRGQRHVERRHGLLLGQLLFFRTNGPQQSFSVAGLTARAGAETTGSGVRLGA